MKQLEECASERTDGGVDDTAGVDQNTVGISCHITNSQPLLKQHQWPNGSEEIVVSQTIPYWYRYSRTAKIVVEVVDRSDFTLLSSHWLKSNGKTNG